MPWEQTENEIRHRLHDPERYDRCRSKDLGDGVRMIYCKLKNEDKWEAQALRFDKEKFTLKEAKAWLEDHKDSFSEIVENQQDEEVILMKVHEYAEIKGLEIFKIDTAVSKDYTENDLDNMVTKAEALKNPMPVVISHDENQDLLKADKLPAAGWIQKIYRQGKSLFADLVDVPRVVADLIQKKALKNRSVEIYQDYVDDAGNHHGKVVRRLALLGGAIPKIKSLSDHLALYYDEHKDQQEVKVVSFSDMDESIEGELKNQEFHNKIDEIYNIFRGKLWSVFYDPESDDEAKQKQYQALLAEFDQLIKEAFKDTIGSFSEKNDNPNKEDAMDPTKQKEIEAAAVQAYAEEFAKKYGKKPEELVAELEARQKEIRKQEVENFCENLKKEGLAPKIVDIFKALYLKYTGLEQFAEGETPIGSLEQFMTAIAAAVKDKSIYVEFAEQGKMGDSEVERVVEKEVSGFGEGALQMEELKMVKAYQRKHNCTFEEAYDAVKKNQK